MQRQLRSKKWKARVFAFCLFSFLLSFGSFFAPGLASQEATGDSEIPAASSYDESRRDKRDVQQEVRYEIGGIQTAGNRSINSSQILSRVRSRIGQLFDAKTASEDAKRIAELSGVEYSYYNTAVVDEKIQLTFVVVERNIVRSIAFVGNRKHKAGTLKDKVGLKRGDYLDPIMAESGKDNITEFYRKQGYAFVEVSLDIEELSYGKLVYRVAEGPRVKIDSVKFSGNNFIKTGALKRVIKTKKRKWFFWSSYYAEENIEKDVTRLQSAYYAKGFLDVDITTKLEFNKDKSKLRLGFIINEGPAYSIEEIIVMGNRHFGEKRLRTELKSKQGQVYSRRKADSDVKRLLKLYRENGFVDVQVEQERKFVSKDNVRVKFDITEGERFRIGQINITGNQQTQDKVVRRVLDEYDFQPGKWYNAHMARGNGIGELEKKIQRIVLAESATITSIGEVPGQKDAQVSITEGRTGSVMLGAGVASDSGVIGQLVLEQRNFDIKDWPESFRELITGKAFKGAGQSLRIALEPGTEFSEYSINFTEPYFKNKPISLNIIGLSYERERESYNEQRTRGYVGFEKRYKNRWRRSISFRLEDVDVDSVEFDAPKEIKDVKGSNNLAGVRIGIRRDHTDDVFVPSRGYHFNASYEQVGGDHTFGILSGTYRRYKTIREDLAERRTVLATKLHGATVIGDAPPFEKFYAGGTGASYGIRGFDYRGVSTRGINSVTGKKDDPIGSDWILLANAELIVPLASDNLSALFFVDSGVIDSGGYRVSIGTGVQILIPRWFGSVPMRFEIAVPVMKDGDDDRQVFSFSVGRLF